LLPPLVLTVVLMGIYASFVHVADASQRIWGDSAAPSSTPTRQPSATRRSSASWPDLVAVGGERLLRHLVGPDRRRFAFHRRKLAYAFAIAGIAISVADRPH